MAAPIIKVYSTTSDKLSELPVVSGQLIFLSDLNKLYLDLDNRRLAYNVISTLELDADRASMDVPQEGYYFIEETATMWWYKDKWVQITNATPKTSCYIYANSVSDFPSLGNDRQFYVAKDSIYRWDELTKTYVCLSSGNTQVEWEQIGDK